MWIKEIIFHSFSILILVRYYTSVGEKIRTDDVIDIFLGAVNAANYRKMYDLLKQKIN